MTREQTTLLKGVAILMMLFLHLFNKSNITNFCEPFLYIGNLPLVTFISRACNPVGIFLMLSGYGLCHNYYNNKLSLNNQSKRLLKLYIHYWIILIIFVSIGHFINADKYPGSMLNILLNFTSISSSYNSETWFLFPYMLLSLTSLWIFKCIDKIGNILSLVISGFLYLASCYIISRYIAPIKAYSEWYNYILTYFDVLGPFVIGAVLYRLSTKDKINFSFLNDHQPLVFLILICMVIFNCFLSNAATSPFFQTVYVLLFIHISIPASIKQFLLRMGKHSMVMWLTHSFFCYHLFHDFIYSFKYPLLIYVVPYTTLLSTYVLPLPPIASLKTNRRHRLHV